MTTAILVPRSVSPGRFRGGAGKTTVRGGYQMTFQQGQVPNALTQENVVPGSTYSPTYQGDPSVESRRYTGNSRLNFG